MGGQQMQVPILCGIFKANLEEAKDIGDVNVLAEVAEKVGLMSKDEARHSIPSVGPPSHDRIIGREFLAIGRVAEGNH